MIEKERQKRLRNVVVVVLVEGGVVNSGGVIEQRVRINKNQVPGAN